MGTPRYYQLADGRDLADFTETELYCYLSRRVTPRVYHCLISAMEHRFRNGAKEGMIEHDLKAEKWWTDRAEMLHDKDLLTGESKVPFENIVDVCRNLIEIEQFLARQKGGVVNAG